MLTEMFLNIIKLSKCIITLFSQVFFLIISVCMFKNYFSVLVSVEAYLPPLPVFLFSEAISVLKVFLVLVLLLGEAERGLH